MAIRSADNRDVRARDGSLVCGFVAPKSADRKGGTCHAVNHRGSCHAVNHRRMNRSVVQCFGQSGARTLAGIFARIGHLGPNVTGRPAPTERPHSEWPGPLKDATGRGPSGGGPVTGDEASEAGPTGARPCRHERSRSCQNGSRLEGAQPRKVDERSQSSVDRFRCRSAARAVLTKQSQFWAWFKPG